MKHRFKTVIVFLLMTPSINAQDSKEKVPLDIDGIVKSKTESFDSLYKKIKPYSRDSITISKFLKTSKAKSYTFGEAYAHNIMGIYLRNTSQYQKAIDYHTQALNLSRENNYTQLEISSLNMLGVVYRRTDAVRSALDYHQDALAIAENINPKSRNIKKSIAVSLNSMGNIYLALEEYELAIERFSKSLKIEKEVDNKLGLAINYHNIGYAEEGLGNLVKALDNYKISLKYNTEITSTLGKVICNSSIGGIYIKQGKNEEAIALISETLESAKGLRDKFHLTGIYTSLGWAYLKTKNYKKAKIYLKQSQDLAIKYDFNSSMEANYRYLAAVAEAENEYKNAFIYTQKSRKVADDLSKEKNFQYVNDIIVKYDTEKITDKIDLLEQKNEIEKLQYRKDINILIASCVVLALSTLILYFLYRQRKLKNEKKILTLEQDILRSQMNPHFVFNSLNSIKQYIITNEQKNAVYYLNKFAKLMRKILEASKTKEVSLAEELETIKLYFSIENIRFENKIKFNTTIDDSIDLYHVKIPSLLLQPFIENSIWHGLSSKKGVKQIDMEIKKAKSDHIIINITDNGIGRAQSAKIKENKVIKRKSVGLSITNERLTNFVRDYKNKYSLNFLDLKDVKNNAIGTKVILELPTK